MECIVHNMYFVCSNHIKKWQSTLFFFHSFSAYFDYKDDAAFPKPPSYNVATSLPSYDEAERTKAETTIPLVSGRVSTANLSH